MIWDELARNLADLERAVAAEAGKMNWGDAKGADRKKILETNPEAAYYNGRVLSAQFFIGAEFPKFFGRVECVMNNEGAAIKVESENFTGALKE